MRGEEQKGKREWYNKGDEGRIFSPDFQLDNIVDERKRNIKERE